MSSSKRKELGFKELSPGNSPVVDIIAIHGLDGHRERTWTAENGTMWLQDLLPRALPNARILTYGYDADTRSFSQTSTQNINRHAGAFVAELSQLRSETPERPIIFIAHSLGGIILKKALGQCHATGFNNLLHHRAIKVSTFGILYFGTPHSGANGVQLAEWLGMLCSIFMYTTNKVVKDLCQGSEQLEEIQHMYLQASDDIKSIFFYETYRTPIVWGFSKLIVPSYLATIAGDRNAEIVPLNADHVQIVKFDGADDKDYEKVAKYISGMAKEANAKVENNWDKERRYRSISTGEVRSFTRVLFPKPRLSVSRNYVERPELQEFLTRSLLPTSVPQRQPRCVLHGLGGSGKTQLASYWIEAHQERFNRIIIIDASSREQIEAELEAVVRSIGPQYKQMTWRDAVTSLSSEKGWLMFIDNADGSDLHLKDYIPNSLDGAVLITTRNRDYINYAPDCHRQVGELSQDEALDLFHKVANINPSSKDMSIAIVNELGMLALAITQAGTYIFKTKRLDTYLSMFQKHGDELMREASLKHREYDGSTYTAFDLSFGLLPKNSQEFMKICAFFHHSSIPQELFEKSIKSHFRPYFEIENEQPIAGTEKITYLEEIFGPEWDEFSFERLIEPIERGSLIDIVNEATCSYNIHPLVQSYIRDLLSLADQDWYAFLAGQLLLGAINPPKKGETNAWSRQLGPHIYSLPIEVKAVDLYQAKTFSGVLIEAGNWNSNEEIWQYCYSSLEKSLGQNHPDTLKAMDCVALSLSIYETLEGENLHRKKLEIYQKTFGIDHPDTINAMSCLAAALSMGGQLEEEEKMRRNVLEIRNQLDEAETMQQEVLGIHKKLLGPDHPDTIKAMGGLAVTLSNRGQLEEAEKMQREVLEMYRKLLGLDHLYTINAMGKLALTLSRCGQLEEAEKIQREVLDARKKILGLDHFDTIKAMGDLTVTLSNRGQLEEAEKIWREVLDVYKKTLGLDHLITINAMIYLGFTLLGSVAKNLPVALLGTSDDKTSTSSVAWLLVNLAQLKEAYKLHQDALELSKKKFTAFHMGLSDLPSRVWLPLAPLDEIESRLLADLVQVQNGHAASERERARALVVLVLFSISSPPVPTSGMLWVSY
ncbi:TPR-like protein [Serendipita vermifera]|nr:TPR-like protein [Serendipita vermifera]